MKSSWLGVLFQKKRLIVTVAHKLIVKQCCRAVLRKTEIVYQEQALREKCNFLQQPITQPS